MNFVNFTFLIAAYLLGSLNSAIVICYLFRLPSPRSVGSGNPGTTNVLRIGGKLPAALTLIFDILKGVVPVAVAKVYGVGDFMLGFIALYAILGHVFPIFFGFKGGKGVATLIGALVAFSWIVGLIFLVTWLVVALVTKYSSLSALVATITSCTSVVFLDSPLVALPFLIIAALVIIKHKGNIQRLASGQESKIGDKAK